MKHLKVNILKNIRESDENKDSLSFMEFVEDDDEYSETFHRRRLNREKTCFQLFR